VSRIEKDYLGERTIPDDAYWGVQTLRAKENFPISGLRAHPTFTIATACVKKAAALANMGCGALDKRRGSAIARAAGEIIDGRFHDEFIVDVFQAGAGTSHHMNATEVIANRAIELLGGKRGDYSVVHPNDHVNYGQSTNDVYPTAMRIAAVMLLGRLRPILGRTVALLQAKSKQFADVVKSGRTHLQDATLITLGAEFGGYAIAIRQANEQLEQDKRGLHLLGIGGSAVGTGVNTAPGYREAVVKHLGEITGLSLYASGDLFEAMQSMQPFVRVSGGLKGLAIELIRVANDLRLLASGPNTGLAELKLPAAQPGSSIMPGKINPSLPEMLNMVCFQVIGNDLTIAMAAQAGQLELNVMMPVICFNLLQSIEILTHALDAFNGRCLEGLEADVDRCRHYAHSTVGLATLLNPIIGYHRAAEVAKKALQTGKSIAEIVIEDGLLKPDDLERLFRIEGKARARKKEPPKV
jgi:fumarate hydratase class II/aspartate ammonia-lyase